MSNKKHKEHNITENKYKINKKELLVWQIFAAICLVLFIGSMVIVLNNNSKVVDNKEKSPMTGEIILAQDDMQKIADLTIEFLKVNFNITDLTLNNVSEEKGLLKMDLDISGQKLSIYTSQDGELLFLSEEPINKTEFLEELEAQKEQEKAQAQSIEKVEKPKTELFIWSYCPYGVTALSPFGEVVSVLGETVDAKVYLYYAGHGDYEAQQNKIQACIQDLGYSDKYWDFAVGFSNNIYSKCSGDISCDKEESIALMNSLGIDSVKVLECVEAKGDELVKTHADKAKEYGVTGSPSLFVNGVKVNVARNAQAFKTVICSGYSTQPEACSQVLDSQGASATGNC
ncbi:MAG: hypothetical protein PHR26_03280 [Candidatus ainarchaeum sp.]|nr:hypothetical protein [Candidatus ainarchaeum sp.]MDD3976182.1 hypothetical protein [Candidatus ainarchaeum sp.]